MNIENTIKEFQECQSKIKTWKKIHRTEYFADIVRLERSMEKIYTNYTNILVDYRRTKKERYLEQADQILQEGIDTVKNSASLNYWLLSAKEKCKGSQNRLTFSLNDRILYIIIRQTERHT